MEATEPPRLLRWLSLVPFTIEEWVGIGLLSEDYCYRVFGALLGMNMSTVWLLLVSFAGVAVHVTLFIGLSVFVWLVAYLWMQRGFRLYRPRVVFALQSPAQRKRRHSLVAIYVGISIFSFVGSLLAMPQGQP
jgi:hypothetical protein